MSASGTMMLFIVCVACFLCGNWMKAKWKRALLMIVIIFYVLPIPNYKYEIIWRTEEFLGHSIFPEISLEGKLNEDYMIVHTQDRMVLGDKQRVVVICCIISIAIALMLIWRRLHAYHTLKKQTEGYKVQSASGGSLETFAHIKKELRIRREVKLYQSSDVSSPVVTGIFRPVVWLPQGEAAESEWKGVLYHELAHISHHDLLFYCVGMFTVALHWFNPCCYILLPFIRMVNEQYSDEIAVAHLTGEERIRYCEMMIQAAGHYTETPSMGLGVSSGKRIIKRRIQRIMGKKKKYVALAAVVGTIGCIMSTGVAFAYEEPQTAETEVNENAVDMDIDADTYFSFDTDATSYEMSSDESFVDENGQVYVITDQEQQQRVVCTSHKYVAGTYKTHKKDSSGGCVTKYYHAKICERCRHIVIGELYQTTTCKTCTHDS